MLLIFWDLEESGVFIYVNIARKAFTCIQGKDGEKLRSLVTGSAGFIGKNLVEALKERGDEVFEWDIKIGKDYMAPFAPFPPVDEVYHLACLTQMAAELDPVRSRFVNGYGTYTIAQKAADIGARFVYTSTASVYGNAEKIPTPVTATPEPLTAYASDKLKGERYTGIACGASAAIFRLSNVYGPYQTLENPYCGVVGRFIEQALNGEPLTVIGDGNQTRDFTYVGDVVEHLMNPDLKGLFNCSHGKEIKIFDVAGAIDSWLDNEADFEWIKPRSVDIIQRRCLVPDVSCPTKLLQGLTKTLEWHDVHR